ncbi:MAG: galactokinase [Ruminococcaceae bacterium]|nr:galactokinase [Oscillospiraceae bacterium]
MNIREVIDKINADVLTPLFGQLYGCDENIIARQKRRYIDEIERFAQLYPLREDIRLFSAPGRTEIGGNHTDHQHGCVLAAAVNLDAVAVVSFHDEGVIRISSRSYEPFEVSLADLSVNAGEGGSAALVRGIVSRFAQMGVAVGGFDACITSDVLSGSGISSSAAFEILIGTIIDAQFNGGKAGAVEIAKIGQYAENVYFGKNCGLMDQTVSAVGGLVAIDFHDTRNPMLRCFSYDFEQAGYCLCITDTKGSHADLTDEYAVVRAEMESVAAHFGKGCLREVDEKGFFASLPEVRKTCSDRAILRAAHFFEEHRRAQMEAEALECSDISAFLNLVRLSGESSATLLQNLYSCTQPAQQAIPLGIMLSKHILQGRGAVRVHGGGFAGTIQAFVPLECAALYMKEMDSVFGEGSCMKMRIRPIGGVELTSPQD